MAVADQWFSHLTQLFSAKACPKIEVALSISSCLIVNGGAIRRTP